MTTRAFSRNTMLATGILAVLVILMSQAFSREAGTYLSRIKTEKSDKPAGEQKTFVAAPADAVTSAQAAEKADTNPSVIREILLDDGNDRESPVAVNTYLATFLKTLFRTVIAPQAP